VLAASGKAKAKDRSEDRLSNQSPFLRISVPFAGAIAILQSVTRSGC